MSKFLSEWKKTNGKFIKPKLHWYFGSWYKEGNLPVWRHGNIIRFGSNRMRYAGNHSAGHRLEADEYGLEHKEYEETWNYGKLIDSKWTDEGKKRHPFISKFLKPSYMLPDWLSFYFFNSDIMYKTKWEDDDFRYEYPAHITFVIFGICLSVTAYIPKKDEDDWTCQDDYWESLLTYNYYNGDLKKTNEVMGWWGTPGEENFRFCFQPRFLTDEKERNELIEIQGDVINGPDEFDEE